jgi:predicted RNase H-like HicB family nuclease
MRLLNLNDYVRLALSHATLSPNDVGSWTAEIAVLPGCVTWGETRAEAALMAKDAVQGWPVTALRFGDQILEIDGFVLSHLSDAESKAEMIYA